MRLAAVVALAVLAPSAACRSRGAATRYWADRAEGPTLFQGQDVVALAAVGQQLYVSTGTRLFRVRLTGDSLTQASPTDVTASLVGKAPADEITAILVDRARDDVWIVTNSNTRLASCYDAQLEPRDCPRGFLDERIQLMETLERTGARSSVDALAFDSTQAVVGYFKDGVYLYSLRDRRAQLVYRPSDPGNSAVSAVLTGSAALVAMRGDGLVVVDRQTGKAVRFADRGTNDVRAVAVLGQALFIGGTGLYRARLADFAGR